MSFGDYEGLSLRSGHGCIEDPDSGMPIDLAPFVAHCMMDMIVATRQPVTGSDGITLNQICEAIADHGGNADEIPLDDVLDALMNRGYITAHDLGPSGVRNIHYGMTSAGCNFVARAGYIK